MKKFRPIVWMSPWNSYFKSEQISYLLEHCIETYWEAVIMIPDLPAISTYLALWYSHDKSVRKSRLEANWLRNKISKAMVQLNFNKDHVKIIDWKTEIDATPLFIAESKSIRELYWKSREFRKIVNDTSEVVLKFSWKEYGDEQVLKATEYLLDEIAFLNYSPTLLNTEKVVYIYHKPWEVFENFIAWEYDNSIKTHLEYKIVEYIV